MAVMRLSQYERDKICVVFYATAFVRVFSVHNVRNVRCARGRLENCVALPTFSADTVLSASIQSYALTQFSAATGTLCRCRCRALAQTDAGLLISARREQQ